MKLSNKSKSFLQKYQLGDVYEMQDPYNYLPSLEEAQQSQIVQLNQPKNQVAYQSVPNTASIKNPLGFVPFIGPALNLGIGVKNIIDSFGEKKRQRNYQRAYEKDLRQRREEARTSDYYHTPYMQLGGELNDLDTFLDYYESKENQNNQIQKQFNDYYTQKNDLLKNQWKTKMNEGFSSALSGAVELAAMFQQGGVKAKGRTKLVYGRDGKLKIINIPDPKPLPDSLPNNPRFGEPMRDTSGKSKSKDRFRGMQEGGEYDPTKDLYSPEYVVESPEIQTLNNEIIQIQQEDKQQSLFENWLFQDDYEENDENEINNSYFNSSNSQTQDVISQIGLQESGGNYQAKNPYSSATGKYQFTNQWAGKIKSFMGLPQSYNTDQVMEAFKNSPDSQEDFMQYVVEDIYKPEVEKLRPLAQRYGLNDDKLIRMLHYRGISDTRKRLQSGDFSVSEEEKRKFRNPDILTYLNKE